MLIGIKFSYFLHTFTAQKQALHGSKAVERGIEGFVLIEVTLYWRREGIKPLFMVYQEQRKAREVQVGRLDDVSSCQSSSSQELRWSLQQIVNGKFIKLKLAKIGQTPEKFKS